MTDDRSPEEELEIDGEDQASGHDGAPMSDESQDEDLDDELDEQEEEEEQERDEGPRSSAALPQVRGKSSAAAPAPARTGVFHSEDELPYIDDRASKIWVGAIVAVFALILVYGLLFGKAGALTPPTPSPEPTPSRTPAASVTAAPSPSITAVPSVTISPVPSVTPAPTPAPSPTAAPSAS